MEKIDLLLNKYNHNKFIELRIKETIINKVKEITGLELLSKDIKLSNDTILINTSPQIKTKLKLKSEVIIKDLKDQFNNLPFKKIN